MDWEPWIEHDGEKVQAPNRCRMQCEFDGPGFCWRWKQVKTGWFRSEWQRVCDDPAYAPLIRYRIRRPRGLAVLRHIAANPDAPIVAPELERASV